MKLKIGDYWTDSQGDILAVRADGHSYVASPEEVAELAKVDGLVATIRRGLYEQFIAAVNDQDVTLFLSANSPSKRLVAIGNRDGVTAVDPDWLDYQNTVSEASYRQGAL